MSGMASLHQTALEIIQVLLMPTHSKKNKGLAVGYPVSFGFGEGAVPEKQVSVNGTEAHGAANQSIRLSDGAYGVAGSQGYRSRGYPIRACAYSMPVRPQADPVPS
jgi:hypothetical protein